MVCGAQPLEVVRDLVRFIEVVDHAQEGVGRALSLFFEVGGGEHVPDVGGHLKEIPVETFPSSGDREGSSLHE